MQKERHNYLGDIIANVSGGVARGEQASDVQSAHLDLVTLTHLPGLSSDTHPRKIYPWSYLLCDPLNPVVTTKDNQSWYLKMILVWPMYFRLSNHLLNKVSISTSMVPVMMSCQQGGQSHLMGSEMGIWRGPQQDCIFLNMVINMHSWAVTKGIGVLTPSSFTAATTESGSTGSTMAA